MKGVRHCLQRAAATINTERHRSVLVACNPFDQRVLYSCVPHIVDERVPKTVERLSRVGDALLGLIPTEPL